MKKLFLLVLLLNSIFVIAQESQAEFASTYLDGPYNWFRNMSGAKNPESYQDDGPVNMKFIKDDAEEVVEIKMEVDGEWKSYFQDARGTSFVRYYRIKGYPNDRCLFFDKKGLWVVEISEGDELVSRINAFLGSKETGGKGQMEKIQKYLDATKKFQEKEKALNTIKDHEVTSITAEFVWLHENKKGYGEYFRIGLTTTRDDGVVLKNLALGGNQHEDDYTIYLSQRKDLDLDDVTLYTQLSSCQDLEDGKIRVEVKRNDNGKVVFSGRVEAPCFYSPSYLKWQEEKANGKVGERWYEKINFFEKSGKLGLVDKDGKTLLEPEYDSIGKILVWNYSVIKKGNKYGCVERNGKLVVPAIYDYIDHTNSYCKVRLNGKWGIVKMDGTKVGEIKYDELGLMLARRSNVKLNGKWGVIDESGNEVVKPMYDKIGEFSPDLGLAFVLKDDKYGYINASGIVVVPIIYDAVITERFNGSMTPVQKGDAWGFVNATGGEVLPFIFKFDYISNFRNGVAIVNVENSTNKDYPGKRYGMVDKSGKIIVSLVYDYISENSFDKHYKCRVSGYQNFYGLFDASGKLVVPPVYESIGEFVNGYAIVEKGEKFGFITKEYENASPILFSGANDFNSSGKAEVWLDGTYFDLKEESYGILRLDESVKKAVINFGGVLYVLNDTQKEINVTSGGNMSTFKPGDMYAVQHYDGGKITIQEGYTGEKIDLLWMNDKSQSGKVYRISPYIK